MENIKCPNCGKMMNFIIDGSALNYSCPFCGCGVATTIAEGINWDSTEYEITILPNNNLKIENIRLISNLTGNNFIISKNILKNGASIFKGRAVEVKTKKEKLDKYDIKYQISPDYKY
jgi:hypothetical protein